MERRTGVWIDHERAVIVTVAGFGTSIQRERSEAGSKARPGPGSQSRPPKGARDAADEKAREARFDQALRRYYERIARLLIAADEIYICGPGEAKYELRLRLIDSPAVAARILAVETAGRMTDRQFMARVRDVFAHPRPRARSAAAD
jgi:hypothetical protein